MRSIIKNTRLADRNHAVHTVEDEAPGSRRFRRAPCPTCPWRKDAVGEFPAQAFRLSANTGTDAGNIFMLDDPNEALHTFGCHSSSLGRSQTCAGYVLNGDNSLGWRVAYTRGRFAPNECHSDVPLFDNYYEMAVANGVPPDDPAIAACKPQPMPSFDPTREIPKALKSAKKSLRPPRGRRQARRSVAQGTETQTRQAPE